MPLVCDISVCIGEIEFNLPIAIEGREAPVPAR
jgi:hypothetical protein